MNVNLQFRYYHVAYNQPIVHNLIGRYWQSYVVLPQIFNWEDE